VHIANVRLVHSMKRDSVNGSFEENAIKGRAEEGIIDFCTLDSNEAEIKVMPFAAKHCSCSFFIQI
jgi:hypothetical protein